MTETRADAVRTQQILVTPSPSSTSLYITFWDVGKLLRLYGPHTGTVTQLEGRPLPAATEWMGLLRTEHITEHGLKTPTQ